MKLLSSIICVLVLSLQSADLSPKLVEIPAENDNKIEVLVYDGFEGGYFFFTNDKIEAVVLELANKNALKKLDVVNGDYVGQKLKVSYAVGTNDQESSSVGYIEEIALLD